MISPEITTIIHHGIGVHFEHHAIYCNICGWGDVIVYSELYHNGRRYDFCKRHSKKMITEFVKGGWPDYTSELHNERCEHAKEFERQVLRHQTKLNFSNSNK